MFTFFELLHTFSRTFIKHMLITMLTLYRVAQKSKPLPNDQKIALNRIKACQ